MVPISPTLSTHTELDGGTRSSLSSVIRTFYRHWRLAAYMGPDFQVFFYRFPGQGIATFSRQKYTYGVTPPTFLLTPTELASRSSFFLCSNFIHVNCVSEPAFLCGNVNLLLQALTRRTGSEDTESTLCNIVDLQRCKVYGGRDTRGNDRGQSGPGWGPAPLS